MTENNETADSNAPAAPTEPVRGSCENCGRPLLGEYCYACGQPVKGLVRHFSSILGDFADTVLNFDARLPRTLWPLFARPGFLTREYFEGRRVRYVSPVRLFVTISILTFFIAQLTVSFGDGNDAVRFGNGDDSIDKAATVAEVEKVRDEAIAKLEVARKEAAGTPGATAGILAGESAIRTKASKRIAKLQAAGPDAKPTTTKDDEDDEANFAFNDNPWDPKKNPIAVSWLPKFGNDWLNNQAGRAKKNIKRLQEDPDAFKDALLSAVPSTLFILLPVFALMLKVLYVFKRRLYMEHLIVALHSHAFLCLALLLMFTTMALQEWLAPSVGALNSLFGWLEAALWIWMPVYLLIMQKRVYAQGWLMTLLKYCVLGFCYFMLLSFGAAFTMVFSLVRM